MARQAADSWGAQTIEWADGRTILRLMASHAHRKVSWPGAGVVGDVRQKDQSMVILVRILRYANHVLARLLLNLGADPRGTNPELSTRALGSA